LAYACSFAHLTLGRMSLRVAVITGGTDNAGKAIALRLASDGLDIAIIDMSGQEDQMKTLADQIIASGRRAIWMVGDVTDENSVKDCVQSVVEKLGSLDVVRQRSDSSPLFLFHGLVQMVANQSINPNVGASIPESEPRDLNYRCLMLTARMIAQLRKRTGIVYLLLTHLVSYFASSMRPCR
jgi:nucleoside-diphosphate-sugar epimerase